MESKDIQDPIAEQDYQLKQEKLNDSEDFMCLNTDKGETRCKVQCPFCESV